MPRALLAGLAAIAAYYFVYWMGAALLSALLPIAPGMWVATLLAVLAAIAAGRFIWTRHTGAAPGLGRAMGRGALTLGAIGFVGGFFGPMIFAPGANQGPLLGLFITGPAGVVLGGVAGAIWWFTKTKGGPDQA